MGHRGQWAIGQLDIDPAYRDLLVDILAAGGKFMKKNLTAAEKKAAHGGLVETLARAEVMLPLYFNTDTTHQLRHLGAKVRLFQFTFLCPDFRVVCECYKISVQMEDFGSFWAINMLAIERMHVLLKRMASGSRNVMQVLLFVFVVVLLCLWLMLSEHVV